MKPLNYKSREKTINEDKLINESSNRSEVSPSQGALNLKL